MATYAVFGGTGNCGSSLIHQLLATPENTIHAYCRSATKLSNKFPSAVSSGRVKVFEGQIDDVEVFSECIRACRAIFLCVTANVNIPGMSVAQDTTRTLLAALKENRSRSEATYNGSGNGTQKATPKICVLSSSSLDRRLCRNIPSAVFWFLNTAGSCIYADLRVQERLLRDEESWLTSIFVKPGGLVQDQQRGHKLNLEQQETFISYHDLAAGMLEAVEDPDGKYDMKDVSVNNVNGSARFPKTMPLLELCNVLRHYFPWLHAYLPNIGLG